MTTDIVKLIDQLKREIVEAERTDDPLFRITGAEIEIAFTIEGETHGGFDLQIVKTGASVTESRVHRVTVMLETMKDDPRVARGKNIGES